ncbi:MAG: aminodeoxychorismate synthase, component I, partial [Gammaproteobacteria bacterium]
MTARSQSSLVPLVHELPDPGDLLALHCMAPERYPFLLESAAAGTAQGRCDLLLGWPGAALVLDSQWRLSGPCSDGEQDFLRALDRWWRRERGVSADPWPLAGGGWFLYLGYELAAQVEPVLHLDPPRDMPVAFAVRTGAAVLRDRASGRCRIMARDAATLRAVETDLANAADTAIPAWPGLAAPAAEESPETFLHAVRRAREYIVAG